MRTTGTDSGPYEFLVDTGSSTTLVDDSLIGRLQIASAGKLTVAGVGGIKSGYAARVDISVGTASQRDVEVVSIRGLSQLEVGHPIQGVLGENFLRAFDVLIDNDHSRLTLDSGSRLAASLEGERMPFHEVHDRPHVSLLLRQLGAEPTDLLLDSGAGSLILYPQLQRSIHPIMARTVYVSTMTGVIPCSIWQMTILVGRNTFGRVDTTVCDQTTAIYHDSQGNLPTSIFHALLLATPVPMW